MITISKEFRFEASHVLPRHDGKCSRLHGHSWHGWVSVTGQVDPNSGFVVDYGILKQLLDKNVVEVLDHRHLGHGKVGMGSGFYKWSIPPFGEDFYPSSENLVRAIARILEPLIAELRQGVKLTEVGLHETCTSCAIWRPEPLSIRELASAEGVDNA